MNVLLAIVAVGVMLALAAGIHLKADISNKTSQLNRHKEMASAALTTAIELTRGMLFTSTTAPDNCPTSSGVEDNAPTLAPANPLWLGGSNTSSPVSGNDAMQVLRPPGTLSTNLHYQWSSLPAVSLDASSQPVLPSAVSGLTFAMPLLNRLSQQDLDEAVTNGDIPASTPQITVRVDFIEYEVRPPTGTCPGTNVANACDPTSPFYNPWAPGCFVYCAWYPYDPICVAEDCQGSAQNPLMPQAQACSFQSDCQANPTSPHCPEWCQTKMTSCGAYYTGIGLTTTVASWICSTQNGCAPPPGTLPGGSVSGVYWPSTPTYPTNKGSLKVRATIVSAPSSYLTDVQGMSRSAMLDFPCPNTPKCNLNPATPPASCLGTPQQWQLDLSPEVVSWSGGMGTGSKSINQCAYPASTTPNPLVQTISTNVTVQVEDIYGFTNSCTSSLLGNPTCSINCCGSSGNGQPTCTVTNGGTPNPPVITGPTNALMCSVSIQECSGATGSCGPTDCSTVVCATPTPTPTGTGTPLPTAVPTATPTAIPTPTPTPTPRPTPPPDDNEDSRARGPDGQSHIVNHQCDNPPCSG